MYKIKLDSEGKLPEHKLTSYIMGFLTALFFTCLLLSLIAVYFYLR